MEFGFTTAAYVVAAILFILSLGGLSGQESAKRAVWYGIVGMALAVAATLIGPGSGLWLLSVVLIAGGGFIGWQTNVPGKSSKEDNTCVRTPCFMASATERVCRTFAPRDAISSISSYVTRSSLRAFGTIRGSVV